MQNQEQRFSFTGSGSEYFRIWIVNLLLTIITLGIYSAWAKVKRLQYFYRNTWLNGSSFDYHGLPLSILKGRILAVALFVSYKITIKTTPLLGLAIFLLIGVLMPWLVLKSLQFRLRNTSYRGLRFSFVGTAKGAYRNLILFPALATVTLSLLWPLAQQRMKKYQHGNSRFGQTQFAFDATTGSFFKIYVVALLMTIVVMLGIGALVGYLAAHYGAMPMGKNPSMTQVLKFAAIGYGMLISLLLLIGPYVVSRTQNLVWNSTSLGQHRFTSALQARKLLWIFFSNTVATIFTLGLFKPFADIRYLRYHVESMGVQTTGNVDIFVAEQGQEVSAVGTEVANLFDFDFGF